MTNILYQKLKLAVNEFFKVEKVLEHPYIEKPFILFTKLVFFDDTAKFYCD